MKINEIITYVKENWDSLPKVKLNQEDFVEIYNIENYDEGWGHHGYEGVLIDDNGQVCIGYSSGCSCYSSTYIKEKSTIKVFKLNSSTIVKKVEEFWKDGVPELNSEVFENYD